MPESASERVKEYRCVAGGAGDSGQPEWPLAISHTSSRVRRGLEPGNAAEES
jgi:hypothetical protein